MNAISTSGGGANSDRQYDLVVTLDDATSAVYSGFIVEEEGTASSFRALTEVLDRQIPWPRIANSTSTNNATPPNSLIHLSAASAMVRRRSAYVICSLNL